MAEKTTADAQVILVPVGLAHEDLLSWLVGQVGARTGLKTAVGEGVPLPSGGYDARRGQYRGDSVLAVLRNLASSRGGLVVGVLDADCYGSDLAFIFGQSGQDGCEAFVALPRLRESFYGRQGNPALFHQRVLKETLHELGHILGLRHCPDPLCGMHFSSSLADTDYKQARFCAACQEKLRRG